MSQQPPEKKRKTWYVQVFRDEWLQDQNFKDWLQRDKDCKEHSYCKCCCVTLKNATKSMLITHKNTEKHKKCFDESKKRVSIDKFLKKPESSESDKLANAEALIAGDFSEHHIPFAHVDHLLGVCRRAFPDSSIASFAS